MRTTVTKKDLSDLSSDNAKIKYRRAKSLVAIARANPKQLYPHLNFFVNLLNSENNILKWTAVDIVGYLSGVAAGNHLDELLDILVRFLHAGKLITANHAIAALSHIALVKPEYQSKITRELLEVEHCNYDTEECRNIAIGKVIQGISSYFKYTDHNDQALEFVTRHMNNARPATSKKAQRILKGIEKSKHVGRAD